jgi:hypothetical protein
LTPYPKPSNDVALWISFSTDQGHLRKPVLLNFKRVVLITAVAISSYALAGTFGASTTMIICGVVAALACVFGSVLLLTSSVGELTWKNRVAGYLIPWGWQLSRGRLWPVPVISWIVWVAIGASAVLLRLGSGENDLHDGWRIALFAAWAIHSTALMFLFAAITHSPSGSQVRLLWLFVAVVIGLVGVSVALYLSGQALVALVVVSFPLFVALGSLALVVLLFTPMGRNGRWN